MAAMVSEIHGHIAPQPRVARAVDLAHSTGADEFVQLIYAEAAARRFSCHRLRACRTRSLTVAGLSRRSLGEGGRIVL
jgi:hypothetical protein